MEQEVTKGTVCFRIDYDWFTGYVRDLWAEGEYPLAINLMTDSSIPVDYAHDIIRGKRKMVQDPDDEKGGMIVDDDWQPQLDRCFLGIYPDPLDLKHFRLVNRYGVKGLADMRQDARMFAEAMNESTYYFDKQEIIKRGKQIPDEIWEFFNIPKPETIHTGELSELRLSRLNPIPGLPSVDEYVKRQLELDKKPKPKPDQTFSIPTGYILPNGKFYSCGYMEHSWLADKLGVHNTQNAQSDGWIQISHPLGQPGNLKIYYGDKEPTQKQLDTLFDWQQKYKGTFENKPGEF